MKTFLLFGIVAFALASVGAEENNSTTVYDYLDSVFEDEKKFTELYSCLMDQEPCPEHLEKMKESIIKDIQNNCEECNPEQKEMHEKYEKMLLEKHPKEHEALHEKYPAKN